MTKQKLTLTFLIVLGCFLVLTIWFGVERQKAVAEVAEAKAELAKVKADLEKTESGRDTLKANLAGVSESFENVKSELAATTQARDRLKEQVKKLQATVEKLQNELQDANAPSMAELYGLIFTTGLTEDNMPINDLNEISISEERIYIFIKWQLSLEKHNYMHKIFDDSGKLVSKYQWEFTPTTTTWDTWSWYNINKYTDKPGKWKCEIYLDGRKMAEEYLIVLPQNEGNSLKQRVSSRPLPGTV